MNILTFDHAKNLSTMPLEREVLHRLGGSYCPTASVCGVTLPGTPRSSV